MIGPTDGDGHAGALRDELVSAVQRWRRDLPTGDAPGNTMLLGIADRAITLMSALLKEITETLLGDEPLDARPTVGQRIGLIQRLGRHRRTTCGPHHELYLTRTDIRMLNRFVVLRNALAHQEGERLDAASLGRYRPDRVADILDVVESILASRIVAETICVQRAPGPTAVIIINADHSRCGACGEGAVPTEPVHQTLLSGVDRRIGCGARFVAMTTELEITPRLRAALLAIRPDLPLLGDAIH